MPFHYLRNHQTFLSITNMDKAVAEHLARHDLTKSERAILLRIAQSALKYPGAAHLKAATIASSTEVSTKTVYRAVKRLQALGILRIIAGTKLNGIKGANMYQIVP
ncbi:MAG: helix-turn-helix domain-containing protein [Solibacillus sp.]